MDIMSKSTSENNNIITKIRAISTKDNWVFIILEKVLANTQFVFTKLMKLYFLTPVDFRFQ